MGDDDLFIAGAAPAFNPASLPKFQPKCSPYLRLVPKRTPPPVTPKIPWFGFVSRALGVVGAFYTFYEVGKAIKAEYERQEVDAEMRGQWQFIRNSDLVDKCVAGGLGIYTYDECWTAIPRSFLSGSHGSEKAYHGAKARLELTAPRDRRHKID